MPTKNRSKKLLKQQLYLKSKTLDGDNNDDKNETHFENEPEEIISHNSNDQTGVNNDSMEIDIAHLDIESIEAQMIFNESFDHREVLGTDLIKIEALNEVADLIGCIQPALLNDHNNLYQRRYSENETSVQIHYVASHYVVSYQTNGRIIIYDSLESQLRVNQLLPQLKMIYATLDNTINPKGKISYVQSQSQGFTNDCGAFSAANAVCLWLNEDPEKHFFIQKNLRKHLMKCISDKTITAFLSKFIHKKILKL